MTTADPMTKTSTKRSVRCPIELELVADGRHQGRAQCTLAPGHASQVHHAHFTQTTGDVRDVDFEDGDSYDTRTRMFAVKVRPAAKAPQETEATFTPRYPAAVTIRHVPLEDLVESHFNKRRTWGDLKELAASMGGGVGILEPLLARPMGKKLELVFGHRRLRAAKLAKLETAPVMIRELDDDVALEMQAIENLQRVDLHPLEEAEGFEQLRDALHWSADDIAAKVGQSKAYVYGRLKLCELGPEGRKAFAEGELSASVALYVSRVPAALQAKCLDELRKIAPYDDEAEDPSIKSLRLLSARTAREEIEELFMLDLKRAPFDTADGSLLPAAGTCAACPKRSGNQKVLFADVDRGDVCTDPICFADKRAAHNGRQAEKLVAKGVHVVEAKRDRFDNVRPPAGYAKLTDYCGAAGKTYAEIVEKARAKAPRTPGLKELQRKTVMLDDRGKSVEVVKTKGLLEAAGVKPRADRVASNGSFDHKAYQAKRELEDKTQAALLAELVNAAEQGARDGTAIMQVVIAEMLRSWGYEVAKRRGTTQAALDKLVASASEPMLDGLLVELVFSSSRTEDLRAACKAFGIDHAAVVKRVAAADLEARGQVPPEPEAGKVAKKASTKGRKK